MASTILQTTWLRPALIIFSEKKPVAIDEANGVWDIGGDDRELTIISRYRKDNEVILQLSENHGLSVGDEIVVTGLDGDYNGTFTVLNNSPNGPKSIKYAQIGTDSGDNEWKRITKYRRKDNYSTFELDLSGITFPVGTEPSHSFFAGDTIDITGFTSEYNGTFVITDDAPDDNMRRIQVYNPGPDTGDLEQMNIVQMKRRNNIVTLKFDNIHPYSIGETIRVKKMGANWNGAFVITDDAPEDDLTAIQYTQKGDDTEALQLYNVTAKKRDSNVVTLQLDGPNTLPIGAEIFVSGLGKTFDSEIIPGEKANMPPTHVPWILTANSVNGDDTKIRYVAEGLDTGSGQSFSIIGKKRFNNEVTLTLNSSHTLKTGDEIIVNGLTGGFNGTFTIKDHEPGKFKRKIRYAQTGADVSYTIDSGTITEAGNGWRKDTGVVRELTTGFLDAPLWYDGATSYYPFAVRTKGGGMTDVPNNYGPVAVRVIGGNAAPDSGTITLTNQDFYYLTDDNRSELSISSERIEYRKRMINGRMRSYHVADKKTFSVSWDDLETLNTSVSEYLQKNTNKNIASAKEMVEWYNNHNGSFYLTLVYDAPNSNRNIDVKYRLEYYEVFFQDFSYAIKYRGADKDIWNINMVLVEA